MNWNSIESILLAQAYLPCVKGYGQVLWTPNGSISSPYICGKNLGWKRAHMHGIELWENNVYQIMLRYKRWTFEAWYQSECTIIPSLASLVTRHTRKLEYPWDQYYKQGSSFNKVNISLVTLARYHLKAYGNEFTR